MGLKCGISLLLVISVFISKLTATTQSNENSNIKISYRLDDAKTRGNNLTDVTVLLSLEAAGASSRIPVALVLVLDVSTSSMFNGQFQTMINTTNFVFDNLQDTDYFGLVTFALEATNLIPFRNIDRNLFPLYREQLKTLQAEGPSNLAQGIQQAIQMHANTDIPDNVIRGIIVISDGFANVGITHIDDLSQVVQQETAFVDEIVRLFTVATKGDADYNLLDTVATAGDGVFLFLSGPEDAKKAFGLQFGGLISTYYQDIVLTIEAQEDIAITGVLAGETVVQQNNTLAQVNFADLRADENREILIFLQKLDESVFAIIPKSLLQIKVEYNSSIDGLAIVGSFNVSDSDIQSGGDPFIDVDVLRYLVADSLQQSKTLTNGMSQSTGRKESVINGIQQAQSQVAEIKQGGLRSLLESNPPPSQQIELTPTGSRRLLQQRQPTASVYVQILDAIDLALRDALNALQNISEETESIEGVLFTILGLAQTLSKQRLEVLPQRGFQSTNAVTEIYITPVQSAIQTGQEAFPQTIEFQITLPYVYPVVTYSISEVMGDDDDDDD
eukprot:TRINITY_DN1073_c0_g1_i12.p1 TRINITY_DN1073_c0_g1~~TRINITY_DN1073_c0_g1_i12.p1  ORF type:complete len:558 (-),score=74.50 TRINITY_DN1073_c0_g1_i12:974-2647(-)